ncbi:hypothetical protein CXF95_07940 [Paraglaciecola sp. MB-3u-78]|nr:hypothetical protein CXF95_07940 [Paraglaciecola sp. MB-3u-78]
MYARVRQKTKQKDRLRPVEQLDKRPAWMQESRITQEQLSRSRDWVPIIMDVRVTKLKHLHQVGHEHL